MIKMQMTVVSRYEVSDDPSVREFHYGTSDPFECAQIDRTTCPPEEFLVDNEDIVLYEIVPLLEGVLEDPRIALQRVLTLHEKGAGGECMHCSVDFYVPYPCATVDAIHGESKVEIRV